MYFGSHISIRNGFLHAANTALNLGASAYQFFPKNPRSLSVKKYNQADADKCAEFCKENRIKSVAHTPYRTKLIPENEAVGNIIIESLLNDLDIANACGAIGVIVHFGSTRKIDPIEGYKKMIEMLNQVLSRWDGQTKILIENNAGAGSEMGTTLEEMVKIRKLTDYPQKIGFCFDTCHAFASGLWSGDNWMEIEKKAKKLGYLDELKAIHFNNSKYPTGKKKDRHANLLSGHISESQLKELIHSKALHDIPFILETPNSETTTHFEELKLLKSWNKEVPD